MTTLRAGFVRYFAQHVITGLISSTTLFFALSPLFVIWGRARMPNYDFVCAKCGKLFERQVELAKLQKPQRCPACRGKAERQLSAPAVHPHVTPRSYR